MADSLDAEVCDLKAWIDQAWRHLCQPTLSHSERKEIRDQMRKADAALRLRLHKCAERNRAQREHVEQHRVTPNSHPQAMRLLNIDGMPPTRI